MASSSLWIYGTVTLKAASFKVQKYVKQLSKYGLKPEQSITAALLLREILKARNDRAEAAEMAKELSILKKTGLKLNHTGEILVVRKEKETQTGCSTDGKFMNGVGATVGATVGASVGVTVATLLLKKKE